MIKEKGWKKGREEREREKRKIRGRDCSSKEIKRRQIVERKQPPSSAGR